MTPQTVYITPLPPLSPTLKKITGTLQFNTTQLSVFFKKITQTAVINFVFHRSFIKLDVSYASQHTFSKVTVTIFENYIYIVNVRGLEPRLRKMICSSTCLDVPKLSVFCFCVTRTTVNSVYAHGASSSIL